ncbi:MAG: hypothetical protein M1391_14585 [Bacteroidetes bacterium]|nr:hypothetical protein [Bacteroidota bacterium]
MKDSIQYVRPGAVVRPSSNGTKLSLIITTQPPIADEIQQRKFDSWLCEMLHTTKRLVIVLPAE